MTDTTQIPAAQVPADDDARKGIAKHELIAVAGGPHTDMQTAVGIRYVDKASGEKFEYLIPGAVAGTPLTMLALFGAKTKATNETSRTRQSGKTDTTSQLEALDEVFGSITDGVWREKAEGGGGTRTDKALLADCLIKLLGTGAKGDQAHYVQRFTDDVNYMRKVLKSDAGEEYRKLAGKTGPAVESLA